MASIALGLLLSMSGCTVAGLDPEEELDGGKRVNRNPDSFPDQGTQVDMRSTPDIGNPQPDQGGHMVDCGGRDKCGSVCTDLMTDSTNCGFCGRTCVLPHAVPACVMGECSILQCEQGWFDVDTDFRNGCEADSQCSAGGTCTTTCNTQGSVVCQGGMEVCQPPTESCNALDDNCDNQCESGLAGCRQGIHRGRNSGHIYSTVLGDIPTLERENYFYLYVNRPDGANSDKFAPAYLCKKGNGKYFVTSSASCEGAGTKERDLGFWAREELCGAIPLYRLYNGAQSNHFYTTSAPERDNAVNNLGYVLEATVGYVFTGP